MSSLQRKRNPSHLHAPLRLCAFATEYESLKQDMTMSAKAASVSLANGRLMRKLDGWNDRVLVPLRLRQALAEPTVDNHRNAERHVERGENLKRVGLDGEAGSAVIRSITAEHVNGGFELAEIDDVRRHQPPKMPKMFGQLRILRDRRSIVPGIVGIYASDWGPALASNMDVTWQNAERFRNMVEWQSLSVDTQRRAICKITRLVVCGGKFHGVG